MKVLIPLLWLAMASVASAADDIHHDIVERAFASLDNNFKDEWSFTETSNEDDAVLVGNYDPRRESDERWALVTVDGREPTAEEMADYADSKNAENAAHDNEDEGSDEGDTVNFETLDLIEETADHWLFSFVPNDDDDADDEEAQFMRHVNGQLKVIKDGHYVEYIDLRNEKPIKPAKGVKISRFETRLTFGPAADGGPIVPYSVDVAVKGRAMLLIKFDEEERVRYSNYRHVGRSEIGAG